MKIGTPYTKTATRVMLLGSGELGKEIAIELIRLGVEVHACDGYSNAPAQQVAQFSHEFDMLDPTELYSYITKIKPDIKKVLIACVSKIISSLSQRRAYTSSSEASKRSSPKSNSSA